MTYDQLDIVKEKTSELEGIGAIETEMKSRKLQASLESMRPCKKRKEGMRKDGRKERREEGTKEG